MVQNTAPQHFDGSIHHRVKGTLSRALLLIWLLLPLYPPIVHAETPSEVDRHSPRATFRSYLLQMIEYSTSEDEERSLQAIKAAIMCLNLAGIPASLREGQGVEAARDLKFFLDRYELVDLDEIPDSFDDDYFVWRKPTAKAEISLFRTEDSLWLFSRRTIESLPRLLDLVRGQAVVEGVDVSIDADGLAGWIRERVSAPLLRRSVYFENWQWIAIILVVIIGLLVERIVITVLNNWLLRLIRRGGGQKDFKLDRQLIRPIGIFAMALVWSLLLPQLDLPLQATTILFFATQMMIAGSGVWAAYRLVDLASAYFAELAKRTDSKFDDLLVPMMRRAMKIIVIAFGLLFIADNFDIDITSLLAGLGIGGIAFALAAKDTVENLFGSLTVMFDKPFEIGDWIKVGDLEGTVEDVGFRSTRIRTFYNSQITMPNSRLVSIPVDNMGRRRYRRVSTKLGVQYDTPPETIDAFCEGIREIIRQHPYTRKDMYMVYFNEYADFSLNILLYVFHETPDWPTELRERHRLFTDILRLAQRLGVQFAFPTQTIHLAGNEQSRTLSRHDYSEDESYPRSRSAADRASLTGDMVADAVLYGREQAEKLIRDIWGEGQQHAVSFDDPGSMGPGGGARKI
ncbi:MAG: mechanosensitive ion channel family protein [Bacteroidia bacterium]|nr:mechanosensitive ion channel family protein [Bacteroidia bacterium]